MAVLAKLHARANDGLGGHLDVSLMNSARALQQASLASFLCDGKLPTRIDSAAPYSAPNEAFEAADGWLMVGAYNGNRWPALCGVLRHPEWIDDSRFASSAQRVGHREAMCTALTDVFRTHPAAHWLQVLREADILCSKVDRSRRQLLQGSIVFTQTISSASTQPRHAHRYSVFSPGKHRVPHAFSAT